MAQQYPEIEIVYFFTDTGKELPEVYEFLVKLEGFIGKQIVRLNPDRDFDFWLKQFNTYLPSPQSRWCTRKLKIRPFEQWIKPWLIQGDSVYSYVAIRADEQYREGYSSKKEKLIVKLPFKEDNIDREGVLEILNSVGLGLPKYYEWRTRSGCTFCFYQQKIEWVRLYEKYPEYFEDAKSYEKNAIEHGSPFTWSQGESLEELSRPARIEQIKNEHRKRIEKATRLSKKNPLRPHMEFIDIDDIYSNTKSCLACHK